MRTVKGTVNSVELIGRLGADPEMRMLSTGVGVCRFSIATSRYAGQDDQGNRQIETDWTNIETWDRLAERCHAYLGRGKRVRITGSLRTDSWTDKESGLTRYRTFVRADDVIFLEPRPDQSENGDESASESEPPF
ncbi:MAG: single-stranded DNA-binding protein [Oscillochloris sp.]|nr:single-stranded DNA-binding protein [Oscillochloris sp.]